MGQAVDLNAARERFVQVLTHHDRRAPAVTPDAANAMVKSICKLSNVCTKANIQHSKGLIVEMVLPSPSRTAALKEYLTALAQAFTPRDIDSRVDTTKSGDEHEGLGKIINGKVQQPPQPAFKRLHLLYLLHDVLMHVRLHNEGSPAGSDSSTPDLQQLLSLASTLGRLTVCGCTGKAAKTESEVNEVIALWKATRVFPATECDDIRHRVEGAGTLSWDDLLSALAEEAAEAKAQGVIEECFDWIVPSRHSNVNDADALWHQLPAANGLFMKRSRGFPLRSAAFPGGGYEIEGAGSEADDELRQEVSALYRDMVRCYDKHTQLDDVQDVDAAGNIVWKDADRPTRNYWGWTLDGIDVRKSLAAKFAEEATGYGDLPAARPPGVNSAVERAKALASARNAGPPIINGQTVFQTDWFGGMDGDGYSRPSWETGRGAFRGGNRGAFRGGPRGDLRGQRGRGRW